MLLQLFKAQEKEIEWFSQTENNQEEEETN